MTSHLTRRGLLVAGGASLAAAALTSCTPGGSPGPGPTTAAGPTTVETPAFITYEGVTPDLPGLANGASAYFEAFPTDPKPFLTEKPAAGGTVRGFCILNSSPVPVGRNPRWQAINEMLGTDLTMEGSPAGDYSSKFSTMVAGGDLPDLCTVIPTLTSRLGDMLAAQFTDLTEHLAGDAINDYPALANFPTYNWQGSVYGNAIRMIPLPRYALFRSYLVRADLAEAAGVDPQPKNGQDLADMLEALSDRRANKFACATARGLLDLVNEMMGTPNNWREKDGRFTKDYEADSFADALEFVAGVWDKDQLHPDSFSPSLTSQLTSLYAAGDSPIFPNVPTWYGPAFAAQQADPDAVTTAITLPSWDGSDTPVERWLRGGTPYFVAIPQAEPDRVRELLRVINALAAPFGTAEHNLIKYGIEGTDYTFDDVGAVVRTEEGDANRLPSIIYLGAPALVHFGPDPEIAKAEYLSETIDMETTSSQPQVGLISETDLKEGTGLANQMEDLIAGVIQGRNTMDDWKAGVAEWRGRGGDTIRGEFEEAFAAAQPS